VNYSVFILPRAQREFAALPKPEYEQVRKAISDLGVNATGELQEALWSRGMENPSREISGALFD
jgi:mRNA-degrading endonuclease RelE of RelBE toxin-antitoxin system